MNRDTLYAEIPNREDLGINEDYCDNGAIRGILFAAAVSIPIWVAAICIAVHFWHKG